jgi:PAS domain S-box-containing protein
VSVGGGPFVEDGELEASRARYAGRLARVERAPGLDRLADVAARLLGAGSAQVSLISDVQTVVAGVGAAADSVGGESPTEDSLCTVTVRAGVPLRVDEAPTDERVASLPPVTSGAVGAYLGVPLRSAGHVIGALCVFDPAPRSWSDDDVARLALLAEPVVAELEFAALGADYEDDKLVWRLAVDAGGVGAFDWDLVTGELRWDERLLELFGLDRHSFGGTIEAFNAAVHPDDRDRVAHALQTAIATCGDYVAEYRVVLPGGDVRWIGARGRALAGPEGTAVRVLGAASDTTAVQDQEERVARVLESMPTAFYHLDHDWRFTYANGEAQRLLGADRVDIIGGVVWELFPATLGSDFETYYRGAVDSGEPVTFEAYYPPPLDGWYEIRAWPTTDGLSVYFVEVSERRRTRLALDDATRRAALLAEITRAMTDTLDADEACSRLAELIAPEVGDWCVVTLVEGPGPGTPPLGAGAPRSPYWRRGLRDAGWWHGDPAARTTVERYSRLRLDALTEEAFLARALRTGRAVVVADSATQAIAGMLAPGEARDLLALLDPGSAVVVPLPGRDRTVGLLTVFRDRWRPTFAADEVAMIEEAGARAGLALDNARLYNDQRDLAEQLQRSMMTAPPEPDHLHLAVRYVPAAEAAQVGGDWYDAFLQPDGATVIVIGDVVGHDTAAAAAMGQLRSILRGIAVTTNASPSELLRQVDRAMAWLQIETTATVVVARLEQTPEEREQGLTRLRWSNAGHPPPLVIAHRDPDGHVVVTGQDTVVRADAHEATVLWGATPNLLLGLNPDTVRDETVLTLPRGTTVLLYTDGLVERRRQLLDTGVGRLADVFADLIDRGVPLEDLCDELLARMLPDRPDDDVALVAVRLHREDRPRPAEAGPRRVPDVADPAP